MDKYCVLGNPVEHSRSPWIHARFAELTGEDIAYERRLIPLDGFAEAVRAFRAEGGKGCNITVPFKFQAARIATGFAGRAALAQAANVLVFEGERILADNTDGVGLVKDIEDNARVPLAGREVLLAGAGGAVSGVLGPLIAAKPARIVVCNRTPDKAQALVDRHRDLARAQGVEVTACGLDEVRGAYDVVVNGTAASMAGAGVPVPPSVLKPGTLAVDMMYGEAARGFMQWASSHGAQPRDGLGMLVEQAAEAFLVWRGVRPPTARVLDELRATLAR
ncbi:MAG TPA: shikimate dehydrogenase [Ramlibacter sp.]|nr:shikimate dehydrogenase [Ramlibacter sp.]HVZ46384.1 shikimate dehydrogenase [Ramlibacter sp.]